MKQLNLLIFVMLFFVVGCLQPSSMNDVSSSSNDSTPYIVDIYVNGVLQPKGNNFANLIIGDSLTIKVNADNTFEPLEYVFYLARQGVNCKTLQDFNLSDQLVNYIVTEEDANYPTAIWIGYRNSDGFDFDSPIFGDHQHSVALYVSGGKQRPVLNSINMYVNGVLRDTSYDGIKVGDVISLEVNASDPNSLPLEYTFKLLNRCIVERELQPFSSSNSLSNFVVTSNEINPCSAIMIGIKNNDGVEYDSQGFGDIQHPIGLHVAHSLQPKIDSFDFYVNGMLIAPWLAVLRVGDVISITVHASDPNALPLEYSFHKFNRCTFDRTVQSFSSSNMLSNLTITSNDINSCSAIFIGVRNNDGISFDSLLFGDRQFPINLITSQ